VKLKLGCKKWEVGMSEERRAQEERRGERKKGGEGERGVRLIYIELHPHFLRPYITPKESKIYLF
jgi:hypothetical protein